MSHHHPPPLFHLPDDGTNSLASKKEPPIPGGAAAIYLSTPITFWITLLTTGCLKKKKEREIFAYKTLDFFFPDPFCAQPPPPVHRAGIEKLHSFFTHFVPPPTPTSSFWAPCSTAGNEYLAPFSSICQKNPPLSRTKSWYQMVVCAWQLHLHPPPFFGLPQESWKLATRSFGGVRGGGGGGGGGD